MEACPPGRLTSLCSMSSLPLLWPAPRPRPRPPPPPRPRPRTICVGTWK